MPLALGFIEEIEMVLKDAYRADGNPLAALRRRYPGVRFSRCDTSDVIEPPHRENDRFNLYLVDDSSHCPCITPDPARATGLLIGDK